MPGIFEYLIKLSISLSVVYLFYFLFLRRLTFYGANRLYLLSYSLICFIVPFLDITSLLYSDAAQPATITRYIPVVTGKELFRNSSEASSEGGMIMTILTVIFISGILFMCGRLLLQFISLRKLKLNSRSIVDEGIKVYQVDRKIIPFSFGDSIFINREQHSREELNDILLHEFVHVRQKHTLDILFSELLCVLNWFNPFAWLIRKSIRQNLEFIADQHVLATGLDRKEYQYLLLKVVGNSQFSIASQFNFSSLKKRIAMMNKMQSARMHLLKFLLALPLIAITLVAFRQNNVLFQDKEKVLQQKSSPASPANGINLQSPENEHKDCLNKKGYCITIADNHGECVVIVKNKAGKIVTALTLVEWDEKEQFYTNLYGEIPPPPPPPPPGHPKPPAVVLLPANVSEVDIVNNKARVFLKDGSVDIYDLTNPKDKAAYLKKYGKLPTPPSVIHQDGLFSGEEFEIGVEAPLIPLQEGHGLMGVPFPIIEQEGMIAPFEHLEVEDELREDEVLLLEFGPKATMKELDQFKADLEKRGYTFKVKETNFSEGRLTMISAEIGKGSSKSNFWASDFSKIIVSEVPKKDGKSGFNIRIRRGSISV